MLQDTLPGTVYHECGHAIIAVLPGGKIDLLTIEPEVDGMLPGNTEVSRT